MLLAWLVILLGAMAWPNGPEPQPFWKTKEKVYRRIQEGDIVVVVKSLTKNHMQIQGGGQVKAPAAFVFERAMDFEQLPKVSGYIKSAHFDAAQQILALTVSALGHEAKMKIQLKSEKPKRIEYKIIEGALQGLSGQFDLAELAKNKTEVGIQGDFRYDRFPIPKVFLGFGLEVIFQRMAARLREHAESEFRMKGEGVS